MPGRPPAKMVSSGVPGAVDGPSTVNDNATFRVVFAYASLAAIGGFLFGYDTGVVSGAMLLLKDEFHLDNVQQELVVSVTVAGAILVGVPGSCVGRAASDACAKHGVA